jgi:hypothetical protein
MTRESEVEKTARFTRHFLIEIIVLFLAILIVIIGVGVYWAWHQEQYALNVVNSLTPKTTNSYTIWISQYYVTTNYGNEFVMRLLCQTDSPSDITFSSANILYNGKLGVAYGFFVPQLTSDSNNPVSQIALSSGPMYSINYAFFDIILPEGEGSPWVTDMTVTIAIQTSTAKGSMALVLPRQF